jgi:hypothetical protein
VEEATKSGGVYGSGARSGRIGMTKQWVVHCKRAPYDIYIGRPSQWGNPYHLGVDGTRKEVIQKFRDYAQQKYGGTDYVVRMLRGKVLGCWCSPLACHGDVLAELANVQQKANT